MNWKNEPLSIEDCDLTNIDHVISMDETGTPTLKNIDIFTPLNKSLFTLTGLVIDKTSINSIAELVVDLKSKYWVDGDYAGKRVVFHSRDIRKKQGAFNPQVIAYSNFLQDLDELIEELPVNICSACIDKPAHNNHYLYPDPTYQLSLGFILERLTFRFKWLHESGVIFLESRGHKEDAELLAQIVDILDYGSRYVNSSDLSCIKGIYFDKKLNSSKRKSYWPLELADVISYRIHDAVRKNDFESKKFTAIRNKLIDFPDYKGHGLKIFPKESTFNDF